MNGGQIPKSTGEGFTIERGDSFETDCYYRTPNFGKEVVSSDQSTPRIYDSAYHSTLDVYVYKVGWSEFPIISSDPHDPQVVWGAGSRDEMCIDAIHYYPREVLDSSSSSSLLSLQVRKGS